MLSLYFVTMVLSFSIYLFCQSKIKSAVKAPVHQLAAVAAVPGVNVAVAAGWLAVTHITTRTPKAHK